LEAEDETHSQAAGKNRRENQPVRRLLHAQFQSANRRARPANVRLNRVIETRIRKFPPCRLGTKRALDTIGALRLQHKRNIKRCLRISDAQ
jgi:hypothetical protein